MTLRLITQTFHVNEFLNSLSKMGYGEPFYEENMFAQIHCLKFGGDMELSFLGGYNGDSEMLLPFWFIYN
jgi:hypothetical protein